MGEYKMPSLGSSMVKARLIKWHVQPGDEVHKGDIIGEIDTEKGLIDIEVFEDGVISELVAEEGEIIPVGSVMAIINGTEKPAYATTESETEQRKPMKKNGKTRHQEIQTGATNEPGIKASPLARKIAEDLRVDLNKVTGSGPQGSIHKKDVEAYAAEHGTKKTEPIPRSDHPRVEIEEERDLDMETHIEKTSSDLASDQEPRSQTAAMRGAIANAMSKSNREIPHYYLESTFDLKPAIDWLSEENRQRDLQQRLMPSMLLVKAVAAALTDVPNLNGYWQNGQLAIEEGTHIGFAISLRKGGLVIPAIMNADLKPLDTIRENMVDLIQRAREGHLSAREVSSATITITSLGERGADKVYGIIYPPQVALVGIGSLKERPYAIDGNLGVRPTVTITLTGDHRATDGHTGSRFLEQLESWLHKPDQLAKQGT
jgi:pyruvate dehydrogenase E2 component (dihydrolipoamide acetyltransferase)